MILTDYQKAQLLYKYLTGDFKYRNDQVRRVSRGTWVKMIDALLENGLIDQNANVTARGERFCNVAYIDLDVLD